MDNGKYSFVSLEEAVSSAKQQLRIEDTSEHDVYMIRLANEAIVSMIDNTTYIKGMCNLDIIDGRAKLPCGFIRLLATRFVTNNGNYYGNTYVDASYLQENLTGFASIGYQHYSGQFQIQNGYIVFNDPQLNDIAMSVAYMGRNIDSNGLMQMSERQERAVNAYICWKFTLSYFERFPADIRNTYEREWVKQKGFLAGLSANERFNENKAEIASIMNAWITNDKNALLRG